MYEEVIQQIKDGDLEPLDKIYIEHKSQFVAYAKNNFGQLSIETIEDGYQDTIIDVYKSILSGRLTTIEYSFKSYIFHIGKIKLIKFTEHQRHHAASELTIVENSYLYHETDNSNWMEVEKAIEYVFSNTSDACKKILTLFYFEKKSMREIALLLKYSNADTVKAKKNRCINQIAIKGVGMFNLKP